MTPTRNSRVSESLTMPVSAFETALRIMFTSLVSLRDEPARRRVLEEGEVEAEDVGEDPALQIGDDALADEGHQHRLPVRCHPPN